jgi:hypothetical protein
VTPGLTLTAREALVAVAPHVLRGAQSALQSAVAPAGSDLTVTLLTIGQSDVVWERFGHNAIWIRDPSRGLDLTYNWGTFDFDQPHFLWRFLTGDTRYWLAVTDAQADIARYVQENRSVWAQELTLTPAQRLAILRFVEWNARPENRYYRYDYYRDNCSTRARDLIDQATGGALRRATVVRATGTTYRWHTRRLTAGDPFVYTGIQLALGRPADRAISAWEESFLPVRLMQHVRDVRVPAPDGGTLPLVKSERQLFAAHRPPEAVAPPSYGLRYLASGLALSGMLLLLARGAAEDRRGAATSFGVLAGLWTLLSGLLGTVVLLAGTVMRHVFMGRNLNPAAYSPLALILLALIVAAAGARSRAARQRWTGQAERLAALGAALTLAGWLGALFVGQRSGEIFALAVPVNLALWLALRTLRRAHGRPSLGAAAQRTARSDD